MGFDVTRFVPVSGDATNYSVDEEFVCPICSGVFQEPVQTPQCEHAFCKVCIDNWFQQSHTCPIDRSPVESQQLKQAPRILRTLLARLTLKCQFADNGCREIIKLDSLGSHEGACEFNPVRPQKCLQGCGLIVSKEQVREHNCISELRTLLKRQEEQIIEMERQIMTQITELTRLRGIRTGLPALNPPLSSQESDQLEAWSASLSIARVTRWGGMISTPDHVLQNMVKRALMESGCPSGVLNDLIENAHERRWPPGLDTLETRQRNRAAFENYVCKRIPGKQAVVALACDNGHMSQDMMVQPGLIMIFAHGIE